MDNRDREKEVIMRGVRAILEAGSQAMEIIRGNKMSNLKTIERSSRSSKDPNPLATTMGLISTKYPLSIDKELAKKYKVPNHMFPLNSFNRKDFHKHNRVLAKMETINWWIEEGPPATESTKSVCDILLNQSRQECRRFYNTDWTEASVSWGPPVLERKIVRTKVPVVEIPRSLRSAAISEVLFKDYTIPSNLLTSLTLSTLKDLANLTLDSKIVLSKQANILLQAMDPGEKCLPVLPGTIPMHIEVKHALVHTNYVVTGYRSVEVPKTMAWQKPLENIARIAIYQGINAKILPAKMREHMEIITINGIGILNVLEESGVEESVEIKWLRVLFGLRVRVDHSFRPLTLCPQIEKIRYTAVQNRERVFTNVASTLSRSSFKMGDLRGVLEHCRGELMSLHTNYTSFGDLMSLLQWIGAYIGWNHEKTTGKTIEACRKQTAESVRKAPHKILRVLQV